ncbi:2-amino-4-hydroxy-6-hydroxymethyldihydropteridinepyrophosphokinase [Pseudidiomarina piscicola]|uniref:2-amino-4-hydroxy-6-hydroxymethyldihydropteridine diphosphokinase n=1 Tax=Pseudidiomarina piscicola TaxID=2614830 RepID=A0A6S6WRJ9_9GAMM|nr:2-amino-4-hydroxy-6-hydroxymethyldihydropteridine diphosphokinase [Pseudidiomarina piscicola]CAB0151940.1 2-amino-4-hydroxy-6-hydroxymethyldihydropteridinepyrophosphokinase [Pseudidiomarina piscicola]VZT41379.1 2-amino-4-hydroxy-6-hydroxymethyldihydropteridinepyrophosphokinase [Pseudomonas aeruginosa]
MRPAQVFLGLGSNRRRYHHINLGLRALHDRFASATAPMHVTRVFESEAVGFAGHDFLNTVVALQTTLSITELAQACKAIEKGHGHLSSAAKYSPRTLDIDVLMYNDEVCSAPVQLPRAEIIHNAFVLWPLAELAPEKRHPVDGRKLIDIWRNYRGEQRLQPIEFEFENLPYLVTPTMNKEA